MICGNWESIFYNCVSNGFYFVLRSRLAEKSAQTYEKCSNLGIFSSFGSFLQKGRTAQTY